MHTGTEWDPSLKTQQSMEPLMPIPEYRIYKDFIGFYNLVIEKEGSEYEVLKHFEPVILRVNIRRDNGLLSISMEVQPTPTSKFVPVIPYSALDDCFAHNASLNLDSYPFGSAGARDINRNLKLQYHCPISQTTKLLNMSELEDIIRKEDVETSHAITNATFTNERITQRNEHIRVQNIMDACKYFHDKLAALMENRTMEENFHMYKFLEGVQCLDSNFDQICHFLDIFQNEQYWADFQRCWYTYQGTELSKESQSMVTQRVLELLQPQYRNPDQQQVIEPANSCPTTLEIIRPGIDFETWSSDTFDIYQDPNI